MSKDKKLNLGKRNYRLLLIGIILLTIGYFIMNTGDHTVSPIILILTYCVIIPLALILPNKK